MKEKEERNIAILFNKLSSVRDYNNSISVIYTSYIFLTCINSKQNCITADSKMQDKSQFNRKKMHANFQKGHPVINRLMKDSSYHFFY